MKSPKSLSLFSGLSSYLPPPRRCFQNRPVSCSGHKPSVGPRPRTSSPQPRCFPCPGRSRDLFLFIYPRPWASVFRWRRRQRGGKRERDMSGRTHTAGDKLQPRSEVRPSAALNPGLSGPWADALTAEPTGQGCRWGALSGCRRDVRGLLQAQGGAHRGQSGLGSTSPERNNTENIALAPAQG
uniref:Uncharacterized protein n=1 Tax=Molossus molossus TaxID=27622 RepID=A0A7J8I9B2_MOLMO|nr:hypothetical protein HJG59_010695 [Molossus molossus]